MPGLYPLYARFWDAGSAINGHMTEARTFTRRLPFQTDDELHFIECGPGTGIYTMEILRRFRRACIVAIDNDANMLSVLARKTRDRRYKNRVELIHGDVNTELLKLLGDGRQFNAAVMSGFLECLDDPHSVIAKIRDVLGKGGVLMNSAVRDTMPGILIARLCAAHRPRSREGNIRMVTSKGFALNRVEELPDTPILWWIRAVKEAHYFQKEDLPSAKTTRFAA